MKRFTTVYTRRDESGKVCDARDSRRRVTDTVEKNERQWNRDGLDMEETVTKI